LVAADTIAASAWFLHLSQTARDMKDMPRLTSAPPLPEKARQPREQLEDADRLRQQGKLDRAEAICGALIRRHPDYVAALHTLGLVYLDKRNYGRALDCLIRASMLDPDNWMTLTALSLAYLRLGATEMSARTLERASAIQPQDAAIFASLGEVHREDREYELAQQAYRQALAIDRDLASAAIGLALCLSAMGQNSEAANVLEEAFKRGHRSLNLLHVMATLPVSTVGIDVLGALDALAARQSEPDAEFKNTFAFVRAAALDKAGRYAEAWQHLVTANRPLAAQCQAELKANIDWREKRLAWLRGTPPPAIESDGVGPISLFILGPSRSGKTSLERLVSSLGGVKAGHESPIVENAVRRTFHGAAIPASILLEDLPSSLHPTFRDHYREDLLRRAGPARVFTSTLHGRIHDAGIIATLIPNSRFLIMKRNWNDVALRMYMTKYLEANSYAYDLKSIRDYLNWYDTMIDLTAEKMPGIATVVSYESMTTDPAAALRQAADLCGLRVGDGQVPVIGHDRDCADPYLEFMAQW
jgi:tetratricopeptide (TPR) repeat protein